MKQFINPSPVCPVCGKHRSAKDVDHSACSKKLKQMAPKKANTGHKYKKQNPVDYWENK